MSNSHISEPWSIRENTPTIRDSRGTAILRCKSGATITENDKANARRIVACVNACVGISNETLESIATHGLAGAAQHLATLTAQRDELLEAISKCLSESNACVGGMVELSAQLGKIRAISNAAIAKCEVKNDG